ncbi:hypothetical protein ACQKWADRAFT_248930 [Trichoderma austrokoningii]
MDDYQKNDTENDIQNYTSTYMQDYTQNIVPANDAEEENNMNEIINNMRFLEDLLDDGEMGTALPPSDDLRNEAVAGGTEDSSATIIDPSSEVDVNGYRKPGHLWCCKKWRSVKTGNFAKHRKTHNPDIPCEADPERCFRVFAFKKELDKHYLAEHKIFARQNGITETDCVCEACGTPFTRPDNRVRHLKRFPQCDEKIKQMSGNS